MDVSSILKSIVRFILLCVIYFISFTVSSVLVGMNGGNSGDAGTFVLLALYCILNVIVIMVFIANSRYNGLRLVGITAAVIFGVQTFMSQVETVVFNSAIGMPLPFLIKVVGSGLINSVLFSLLAVLLLGRLRKKTDTLNFGRRVPYSLKSLSLNILVLAIFYVLVYLVFGHYVAWQFEDIRQFYTGSSDPVTFFAQIKGIVVNTPSLLLIQLVRGFLWALLALLIVNSLRNGKLASSLITGLLFAILLASPLFFPNTYMPGPVRFGHFIELTTSMLAFGIVSGLLLKRGRDESGNVIYKEYM